MNIRGIQDGYTIPKGYAFARFEGNDFFEELGDLDAFNVNVEVESDDRKDNRFGVARTSDRQVTGIDVTVSFTLMQHTNRNRALAVMGTPRAMTQAAETDVERTFAAAKAKQFYDLGAFGITDVVVKNGATTLVLHADYEVDAASGILQPLADFATLSVTFDQPEIAAASKRLKVGIASNPDITCELLVIGTNTRGPKVHVQLWKVRLMPSGDRMYISESERAGIEIEGTALADQSKALAAGDADEFAFGIEQTL